VCDVVWEGKGKGGGLDWPYKLTSLSILYSSPPRAAQHTHGEDERLKSYLRNNKLSANLLDDESDVITLTGAKVRR